MLCQLPRIRLTFFQDVHPNSTMEVPKPDRIVRYPVTGDDEGGRLFLFGNADAATIILTCAGFPDDHESFSPMASQLAKDNNCLVGVACLVGFDNDKDWKQYRSEGYILPEMTTSLRNAAKKLREESTNSKAKLTCIFHDWGSIIGAMYTNQALEEKDSLTSPTKIVYFDVLPPSQPPKGVETATKTIKAQFTEIAYCIVLAVAFLTQRFVSQILAGVVFIIPMMILGILGLAPGHPKDDAIFKERNMNLNRIIYMAYPYYYMILDLLKEARNDQYGIVLAKHAHLPKTLKDTPVLYMYGDDKKIQFHDDNLVKYLGNQSGCKVVPVADAAHWLYFQKPDLCYDTVKEFIFN